MPTQGSHINPSGGIDLLISHFSEIKIWEKMDNWLGKRNARAEYTYADAIQTWVVNMIAGSRRLEHSFDHRYSLIAHPNFKKGMTPDTISRILRSLAVENTYFTKLSDNKGTKLKGHRVLINPTKLMREKGNEINYNEKMNELVLDAAISLGLLKPGDNYELDIDATIIETEVSDSRTHYKLTGKGYCPMVVVLGGIPMFIEARNGNSSPAFRNLEVLRNAIELFKSRGLRIKFVRIDAAGDAHKTVEYLCNANIPFYIRSRSTKRNTLQGAELWHYNEKHDLDVSDNSLNIANHQLRFVDYKNNKRKDKNGNAKMFAIMTNDFSIAPEDVVGLYNQRGVIEQRFADLKEMGWNYMVHRELKFNTIHMHMTILAYVFFLYSKKWLAAKYPFVKDNIKPKTFIKVFISVVTMWVGDQLEFISRKREFEIARGPTQINVVH